MKTQTANQYLASIGIGPVNPVCRKCNQEVGRVWTDKQWCVDCLQETLHRLPGAVVKAARKRPNKRKNFCDLCWAFWHVDVCNGAVIRSAKVIGQPDVEPTLCPDHRVSK